MPSLLNITKLRQYELFTLTLFVSVAFQSPEIVNFIGKYSDKIIYYINILRVVPILLFTFLYIYNFRNIYNKNKLILFFSIIYSLFEFNGINNFENIFRNGASFYLIFSLIMLSNLLATEIDFSCGFVPVARIVLLYVGIFIFMINIFDGNFSLNLYLYLGLLLSIPHSIVANSGFFLCCFNWSYFTQNRTLALISLINLLIYLFIYKILRKGFYLFIFINIIGVITILFVIYEGNNWFTDSILSGRAGIWKFWLEGLSGDVIHMLFGIGFRSDDYINFSQIAFQINGIDYFNQLHSSFIGTLVRGGWILVFMSMGYLFYLLRDSIFDIHKCYISYSLIIFMSLNISFDYIYPNIWGLMLLFTILSPIKRKILLR